MIEKLLKTRFEVIASYPNTKFEVGDILTKYDFKTSKEGAYCYVTNTESPLQGSVLKKDFAETMPHLFKKLNWWDYRKKSEMPIYLKSLQFEEAYKIQDWDMNILFGFIVDRSGCDLLLYKPEYGYEPITEEEYNLITNGVGK